MLFPTCELLTLACLTSTVLCIFLHPDNNSSGCELRTSHTCICCCFSFRGEIIGNSVADKREKMYEDMKIGSDYMFRVDEVR